MTCVMSYSAGVVLCCLSFLTRCEEKERSHERMYGRRWPWRCETRTLAWDIMTEGPGFCCEFGSANKKTVGLVFHSMATLFGTARSSLAPAGAQWLCTRVAFSFMTHSLVARVYLKAAAAHSACWINATYFFVFFLLLNRYRGSSISL